jgi:hypothetical protein
MQYFDFGVGLAFVLMILSTILSVIYGAIRWNKDAYVAPPKHVKDWVKAEEQLEEEL